MPPVILEDSKVYCFCGKTEGADSNMIECENPECSIGWFHMKCVNLTEDSIPEVWFCSDCQKITIG